MPSEEDRMKQWKKWLNDFPVPEDAVELALIIRNFS